MKRDIFDFIQLQYWTCAKGGVSDLDSESGEGEEKEPKRRRVDGIEDPTTRWHSANRTDLRPRGVTPRYEIPQDFQSLHVEGYPGFRNPPSGDRSQVAQVMRERGIAWGENAVHDNGAVLSDRHVRSCTRRKHFLLSRTPAEDAKFAKIYFTCPWVYSVRTCVKWRRFRRTHRCTK